MNSLQLVSKLKVKSDDLNINIKEILSNGTSFTQLEKELLKKQCTDLFELILKLKTEEQEQHLPAPQTISETKLEEISTVPVIEPEKTQIQVNEFKTILQSTSPETTLDEIVTQIVEPKIVIEEEVPAIVPMPIVEPLPPIKTELPIDINIEKAIENKRIQKTVMPQITEKPSIPLNEIFKEREASYNDKNSKEQLSPIVEKTFEVQIDSIKNAITLNKKIAFVNDLFNKNVFEYAKTIDKLNQAIDLNDALRMFNELKHQYNWTNDNELVHDLERLIKRRFIS